MNDKKTTTSDTRKYSTNNNNFFLLYIDNIHSFITWNRFQSINLLP